MEQGKASKCGVIISSSFLVFTFCIFGPFQLYITNASELFFSFGDIWWVCALAALISGTVIIAIGLFLKGKMRGFYCCALWGLSLALYIQGNFVPTDYGTLDGKINWEQYSGVGIWNTIFWLILLVLPFLLYKFAPRFWRPTRNYIALVILGTQIVTLCTLFFIIDIDFDAKPNRDFQLTNLGRFQLSKNENTLVFVLDAYDSQYFSDFIEQHPEYKETLWSDFTFYPNTVGGATRTILAMPQILTGKYYTNEDSYPQYLENAYQSTDLYRALHSAGYNIGVYTDSQFISPSMSDLIMNMRSGRKQIRSYPVLAYYLYRLTACRYLPHELKKNVWMYTGDFNAAADNTGSEESTYLIDDALFYRDLTQNGITLQDDTNVYRLYHLFGAHGPCTLDAKAQRSKTETSLEEQQMGVMHILETYFDKMKQLDIYDSANIVILADHGSLNYTQNPLLLVKRGQETKTFTRSDIPVSYTNLHPTLLSFLQKSTDFGKSIFDLTYEDNKERFFYIHSDDGVAVEYVIQGEASDPNNVHETGKTFSVFVNKEPEKYRLGNTLYFDAQATGLQYAVKGFSRPEASHTWTDGHEVILSIPLDETAQKDIFVSISLLSVLKGSQRVGIYINDQFLNNYLVCADHLNFTIPKEMAGKDELLIRLELPDAASPGADDTRILGLAFESMVIGEKQVTDKESEILSRNYSIGDKIVFTEESNGTRYFSSGVSYIETDSAWSSGKAGQIILAMGDFSGALMGEFELKDIYAGPQKLIVRSNGQILYDAEITSVEEPVKFTIPEGCVKNGQLVLDLEYPNAVSPASRHESTDNRELALRFSSIYFYENR